MLNKGNIILLFLVYLMVFTSIITQFNYKIYLNTLTMNNLIDINIRFTYEITLYDWLNKNLNDNLSSGIYFIDNIFVDIVKEEDQIIIYSNEFKYHNIFYINDNKIIDYE